LHLFVLFHYGAYPAFMLFIIVVFAASAAEKSLKVCKLKYFRLGMYGLAAIFALHLYLHVPLYFCMEVLLLFLQLLDGFFSKGLVFISAMDFG
jgi:hypothetical protein